MDADIPFVAHDDTVLRSASANGEQQTGRSSVFPGQCQSSLGIHPLWCKDGRGFDLWDAGAKGHSGQLHYVNANIQHSTACLCWVQQPMAWICGSNKSEVGLQAARDPQSSTLQKFAKFSDDGEETRPQRFHQKQTLRPGQVHDFLRLHSIHRQGLLTDHVLSSVQRHLRMWQMQGMDGPHIHHIHVGILDKFLIRSMGFLYLHLIRQCLGLAQRAGANGRNVATRRNHPAGEIVADATSAQDAPAHTLRHGGGPCAKPL
mmetsp:Transcript_62430/g.136577  ORF Transcript_62430/g.136577 Transcript_62430/m.136577 type:complete len:260 (+) Transcript_62430:421-1200(+)